MKYGKTIELFLVNGSADSLITAELSNWNGKAIKIPRIEINECTRDDICCPGVYFLFCKEDDDSDSVYIGESENLKERLMQHIRDYNQDKENYYWNAAILFTGRDLNKALIRYLENRLVQITKDCKRYKVLTKSTYGNTVIKESQICVMEEFIENIKILINALGYKVLEPVMHKSDFAKIDDEKLNFRGRDFYAEGFVTTEGFVVCTGSKINEKIAEKSLSNGVVSLRNKLLASDSIRDFVTTKDILFSSSSAAADFVAGYSVSGPRSWKNKSGISLKELEEKE